LKFNDDMLYQKVIEFQQNLNNPNITNRNIIEYKAKIVDEELNTLYKERKRLQGNILDKKGYIKIMNIKQESSRRPGLFGKLFNRPDPMLEEETSVELKRIEEDIKDLEIEVDELNAAIEKLEKDSFAMKTALESIETTQKLN